MKQISEKEHGETRQRIIRAAKKEFAERGYEGARMSSIARRAGVNQALIHYYFNTKENLYVQLLHHVFNVHNEDPLFAFYDRSDLSPSQIIMISIYVLVNLHYEGFDPEIGLIISHESAEGERFIKPIMREYFIPRLERLASVIDEGIARGEFETRNSLFATINMVMFAVFYGAKRESFRGTPWEERFYNHVSKKELLDFVAEHTFKSLLPAGRRLEIPAIPDDIRMKIDEIIEMKKHDLRHDIEGGANAVQGV